MTALRHALHRHVWLAATIIVLALAMRAIVPSGFMVMNNSKTFTIGLCNDMAATATLTIPMKKDASGTAGKEQGKGDGVCPYAGGAHAAIGGADPLLLAAAIAFVLAIAIRFVPIARPAPIARLRPPLRAPPLTI